jgi:4'-phosphopantetheinyl transferase
MARVNGTLKLVGNGYSLLENEVHLWWDSLDASHDDVQRLFDFLSREEQERAARFHFELHRRRFAIGRALLRQILAAYLCTHPRSVSFSYGTHGKPELKTDFGEEKLTFNLSHSEGFIVYAVGRARRIGVDVEVIRPVAEVEQIADRYFSARERKSLRALPETQKRRAFFNCWTRKEAYLKALGDGLARPLDSFDVTLAPGEPARLTYVQGYPHEIDHWSLWSFAPARGTVAALVVEGREPDLGCRRLAQPCFSMYHS